MIIRFTILFLLLLPIRVFAVSDTTTIHTLKGDVLEIYTPKPDTLPFINPENLKQELQIRQRHSVPITLNGQDIRFYSTTNFIVNAASAKIREQIGILFNHIIDSLSPGTYSYHLPDLVIGPKGNVVYYTTDAFRASPSATNSLEQPIIFTEEKRKTFEKRFNVVLEELDVMPLIIDGEAVPFRLDISFDVKINS